MSLTGTEATDLWERFEKEHKKPWLYVFDINDPALTDEPTEKGWFLVSSDQVEGADDHFMPLVFRCHGVLLVPGETTNYADMDAVMSLVKLTNAKYSYGEIKVYRSLAELPTADEFYEAEGNE